jgi:hypothetical protein
VLQWVRSNVYVIDVPPDLGISSTFNIENLVAYTGHTVIPDDPFKELSPVHNTNSILDPIQPSFSPANKESIATILDEQVLFAWDRGVQHFLVCWRCQPNPHLI